MILPVIMAGGSGSRLWPLSRKGFPKQYLTLYGEHSMLQATALRLADIEHQPPVIICNEEHRFSVAEQLRSRNINNSGIILEPVGRNTAPAIALAAFKAIENGDDPLLLVLAADHLILDNIAFNRSVTQASKLAGAGKLVTFGIEATSAETGFGYIKRGTAITNSAYVVSEFVEKPDLVTAGNYISTGNYFWNSGMFLFKASRYLEELKTHRPDIYLICEKAMKHTQLDSDFVRIDKNIFEGCDDQSVDYAVMEPICAKDQTDVVVVPMDCGWSDVGNWAALWDIESKDENANVLKGDIIAIDTTYSYVNAQEKLVAVIGLDDVVIVETKDAILVSKKSEVQKVKDIVNVLKKEHRSEFETHREIYRPWGKYDSVDNGERFQVKRITVKPGAKLSVQMHYHRAEHWIVVSGTAKVINGDKTILLTENQSTYIPIGAIHSLENPGKVDLELIEVQSGSYLGEDDIVRFEDKYGRS